MFYKVFKHLYLDKHDGVYRKIIAISKNPEDNSLNDIIKVIPRNKLSVFNDFYNEESHCIYAFKYPHDYNISRKRNSYPLIEFSDLDKLLGFLVERKYNIDYKISKVLKGKNEKNMLFFIFLKQN